MLDIRNCLNDLVFNSYERLPEYRSYNVPGLEKVANAYLTAASLLATLTSLAFLTPPGGSRILDEGQALFRAFIFFNGVGFFFALSTAVLTITILAPSKREASERDNPLRGAEVATVRLRAATRLLVFSLVCAAVAFGACIFYPLFVDHQPGTKHVAGAVVGVGGAVLVVTVVEFLAPAPLSPSLQVLGAVKCAVSSCCGKRRRQRAQATHNGANNAQKCKHRNCVYPRARAIAALQYTSTGPVQIRKLCV